MSFAEGVLLGAVLMVLILGLPTFVMAGEIGWLAAIGIWLISAVICVVFGGAILLLAWGLTS